MWILDIDKNKAEQYTNIFKKNNSKLFNKKGERNYCSSQIKKTKAYKYLTKKRFIEFLTALPKDLIKLHAIHLKRKGSFQPITTMMLPT